MSVTASPAQDAALRTLFEAIAARDRATVSRLLAKAPALAQARLGVGATRAAPAANFFEAIAHYAYAGDTPLHLAAAAYEPTVARELVALGAVVGARNRRGAEPLHYAADGGPGSNHWDPTAQAGVVAFLIGVGANPNATDKSGVTPLHRAVRTRCAAAVRALLENGGDARAWNGSGSMPLHLAVQNTGRGSTGTAAAREQQAAIIGLLLAHGARTSDKDAAGRSVEACAKSDWLRALLRLA